MANKTFTVSRSGGTITLNDANSPEKVKVYPSAVAARADIANIAEGEIVATKDTSLGIANAWIGTQAEYNAVQASLPDDTLCFILGEDDAISTIQTVLQQSTDFDDFKQRMLNL